MFYIPAKPQSRLTMRYRQIHRISFTPIILSTHLTFLWSAPFRWRNSYAFTSVMHYNALQCFSMYFYTLTFQRLLLSYIYFFASSRQIFLDIVFFKIPLHMSGAKTVMNFKNLLKRGYGKLNYKKKNNWNFFSRGNRLAANLNLNFFKIQFFHLKPPSIFTNFDQNLFNSYK